VNNHGLPSRYLVVVGICRNSPLTATFAITTMPPIRSNEVLVIHLGQYKDGLFHTRWRYPNWVVPLGQSNSLRKSASSGVFSPPRLWLSSTGIRIARVPATLRYRQTSPRFFLSSQATNKSVKEDDMQHEPHAERAKIVTPARPRSATSRSPLLRLFRSPSRISPRGNGSRNYRRPR
jgi:hypothetical protein